MFGIKRDYTEKRNFLRMDIEAHVEFAMPGQQENFTGKSCNLSASGLMFVTQTALEPGTTIDIRLSSEKTNVIPLEANLKILRVQAQGEQSYEVAGELENVR